MCAEFGARYCTWGSVYLLLPSIDRVWEEQNISFQYELNRRFIHGGRENISSGSCESLSRQS